MKYLGKRIIFLVSFLIIIFLNGNITNAQIKNIGLPFITNFNREIYNAETQNWCITQDEKGIMYFANNLGVLLFNGNHWNIYPLPNNSIVRSVAYIDNKIFAGGFNEFGYFEEDAKGNLNYTSISDKLDDYYKSFDEIWRIYNTPNGIIFQSYLDIFILKNGEIKVFEPKSRFGFSYKINDEVYVVDREFGLYIIKESRLVPKYLDDTFFVENEVTFMVPFNKNELLLGTTNKGLFILRNKKLFPWTKNVNNDFIKNQTYTGISISSNYFAIGTIQNGVYILNNEGKIIQQINRFKGLQNNTVLSLFYDSYNNLWIGLDNGIDMLEVNSPLSILNYSNNIETSYTSILYNNIVYIGTNQGLFAKKKSEINNQHLYKSGFIKIDGTLGQVWKLKVIDDKLFCGHNFGTFIIDGFDSKLISNTPGGWDYAQIPWNADFVIGGNYSGLVLFKKNNTKNTWESLTPITGYVESSKELFFDNDRNLWISHGLKGVFKLKLSENLKHVVNFKQFDQNNNLPELPYSLAKIKHHIFILANDSLYKWSHLKETFELDTIASKLIANIKNLTKLIEDTNGDIWYFTETNLGVLRLLEDGTYKKIDKPFNRIQKLFVSDPFENIYTYNKTNTFIGSQEGMLHYYLNNDKDFDVKYNTYIEEVKIRSRKEDTLQFISKKIDKKDGLTSIPYKFNSISFRFFTPFYEAVNQTNHSYRLIGFDDQWSSWSKNTFKEYTNLHEGKYIFEVKANNIYNNESNTAKFSFIVKPPIYRTLFAYIFYVSIFMALIVINLIYFRLKIKKTRAIENEKLIKKEEEFKIESEKSEQKIEQLEQEKLKSEMRLKNIELANSTMNLVQKNKLLTKIKNELTGISDKARSNAVKLDIKQLVIKIDKDIVNDQNLKVFDKYFDQVHQDFVKRIKDKHPNLTPKDLRLCAYLRMNISTKEIAPLLNVSIRGLEISRYRLRKKLNLDHEVNLVDYIMKI